MEENNHSCGEESGNYQKSDANNYVRLYITRPEINYKRSAGIILLAFFADLACSALFSALLHRYFETPFLLTFILLTLLIGFIIVILFLKKILIWLIKVYQARAKIETRLKCCFEPSCSDYAILAIEKYGTIRGVIKTIKRLNRCHPPGGIDYP